MKLYKATDKNMKCRGYQYQMGWGFQPINPAEGGSTYPPANPPSGGSARGTIGSWLVIAERGWNGEELPIKTLKAVRVDGEKIKADTDYILVGGVFKEATK